MFNIFIRGSTHAGNIVFVSLKWIRCCCIHASTSSCDLHRMKQVLLLLLACFKGINIKLNKNDTVFGFACICVTETNGTCLHKIVHRITTHKNHNNSMDFLDNMSLKVPRSGSPQLRKSSLKANLSYRVELSTFCTVLDVVVWNCVCLLTLALP